MRSRTSMSTNHQGQPPLDQPPLRSPDTVAYGDRVLFRLTSGLGVLGVVTVGVVAAVVTAAIFAVQMAVDGVALKSAVDDWVSAPASQKPVAFRVADGIRDVEKGLSGFFQITNGIALLGLGTALALARSRTRWLGVVGALAGVGALIGGWTTAHTGFSTAASRFSLPTVILLAVFVLGVCTLLWRQGFIHGAIEQPARPT